MIRPNLLLLLVCLSSMILLDATTAFVVSPLASPQPRTSSLFAAKKDAKAKKLQVRLLKDVPGTGQKGDVVLVTPPFFQNKLQRTHLAELISDDEVKEIESEQAAQKKEETEHATALQEQLQDWTLTMKRKAGPDGQLFGGIGPKLLMEELQTQFVDLVFFQQQKSVKIVAMMDENGKKMKGDIKHTGEFAAKLSLTKDIAAEFKISVEAEE